MLRGTLSGPFCLQPLVDVLVGPIAGPGIALRALVDTGADGVYITAEASERAQLPIGQVRTIETPGRETSGLIVFGEIVFPDAEPPLPSTTFNGVTLDPLPAGADLLLGMSFLRNFHVVFEPGGAFAIYR